MRGWLKLSVMESRLFLREPLGVFFAFLLPIALIVIFGKIYGNAPTPVYGGHGTVDATVPAYIVFIMTVNALIYLPIILVGYRERGVLFRLQATPLRPSAILAAHAAVQIALTALSALLLIVVAWAAFGLRFSGAVVSALFAFALGSCCVFAMGMVLASLLPTTRVTSIATILLTYPMLLFSGVLIPTFFLAPGLKRAAAWIPLTHVVQLLQGVWLGGALSAHWQDIIILIGVLLLCALLAMRFFRWR